MARKCEIPSDFRQKHGFSQEFLNSVLKKGAGDVELNKDQIQAIVKNLGIDDTRAIELRDGKSHLFGKNLKDIQEFDPSKGKIPTNVLVKKRTEDGTEYFLSERSTDMPPTKWVITDGKRIQKNPDWTFVGKNATVDSSGALKRYRASEGSGTVFKEDPNGDTLLKVSRLFEGEPKKSLYKYAEEGYDGIRYPNGNIHVFDKAHQSVNPEKVTIHDKFTGVDQKVKDVEPTQRELTDSMGEASIAGHAGFALGGALAGETFAEDYGGMWWGGALGFALGIPKIRGQVTTILKGDTTEIKDKLRGLAEWERATKEGVELKTKHGYAGDMLDEEAKKTFKEKVVDVFESARAKGRAVKNLIFKSDYLMSGITRLEDMGIPMAKTMRVALQGAESAHNPYMAIATDVLNKKYGVRISLDEFDQKQADLVAQFANQRGLDKWPTGDTEFLMEQMGASIRRIITHEVDLDNVGKLQIGDERYVVDNVYSDEVVRDFDRYILQSEEGRRMIDAHKEIFDRMGKKAQKSFSDALEDIRENLLTGDASRVFEDFYTSGLSVKQWRQSTSDRMIEMFNKARKADTAGDVFKEAVQFREKILKIDNLRGKYIPQVQSHKKINRMKRDFLENNKDANGTPLIERPAKIQEQAWFDEFKKKIIAYNHDGFTVKGLDAGGGDVETIYFRTFEDAIEKLRNHHAYDIQDEVVRRQVLKRLNSEDPTVLDKFVGIKRIHDKPVYYLKKPDNIDYDNYLKDMNEDALGEAQQMFLNMATFKQSNFLDHARQFILPNEMLETNMRKVINQYARDVGVRTHLVDKGLGTQRQLKEAFKKVETQLDERGMGGRDINKELQSVKELYSAITNTKNMIEVDLKPSEILENARLDRHNHKIAQTVMQLAAMPFMWFTSFYAPFTPAILGSFLSSPRNVFKAYKEIATDAQALKSVTDNLYKYGAIEKKLRSVSEEAQFGEYGRDMLAGSDSAFLDWMYDISSRGINFSTRFSMGKRIIKAMGRDVENAGALRLVTGDLYDITSAESAITSMAVLKEIEDMAEAGKKLLDARQRGEELIEATGGGKKFRLGTVTRRLKELGIEKPEKFIRETMEETNGTRASESYYNTLKGHEGEEPISGYLQNEYSRLMDTVINQYHGRTKLSRPLKWVDNVYGRVLSQFSVYAQNFGVQTVRRRMYQPLKEWNDTYKSLRKPDTPLYEMYWHLQRGNTDKLKEIFGDNWKDAVDDFPVDAVDNFFKVTPLVLGVSSTMMMTRDSVMDTINMVANEAIGNDDYEAWEKTSENYSEIRSMIDEGPTGYNMIKALLGGLGQATQMGMFGRYAQIWRQMQYGDLAGATPATGMASELANVMGEPFKHNIEDAPRATGKALMEYILLRSPVIGTFNGVREGAVDAWFNQPKNKVPTTVDLDI